MKVSEWMSRFPYHIVTMPPESTLEQLIDRILSESCVQDIYIATGEGLIIGHLSHKRLSCSFLAEHRPIHTRRQIMERVMAGSAKDLMEGEFAHARPDEDLDDVLCRLVDHYLQDIPVLDDHGLLVGGINLNTVLRQIRKKPTIIFE